MTETQTQVKTLWNAKTTGLLGACALADFSFWIDFLVILAMAAYAYQANGFTMALVSALFLVPGMLLSTRAGRWVDRNDPGRAIVVGLALRMCVSVVLLLQPSFWLFCICVALRSVVTVPINPGFNVVVSRVVAKSDVPSYFGTLGLLRNVVKISAPFVGTATASYYGDGFALLISIVLAAMALLAFLWFALGTKAPADLKTEGAAAGAARGQAAPGDDADVNSALLGQFLITVTIFAFVVFFINNQLPVLLRDAGFDKALLGALVSCSGAGGVLASVYMMRRGSAAQTGDPMTATTLAVAATSLSFVILGIVFLLPAHIAQFVAGAVFFCTGVCASVEAIRSNTVIVQHFARQAGEVSGQVGAYTSAAMLGAPWIAAFVMPHTSLPSLLILDGLVGIALLALVALMYRKHTLARQTVAD
jgi:MFS family permease